MKLRVLLSTLALLILFGPGASANESTWSEEEVTFRNGDVALRGTLLLPELQQSAPAIVFLHGSGPHERAGFAPWAEQFARLGIASLRFDKRGSGESEGSWTTSSLEDLAQDAVAAIELLRSRKEIDGDRIGFWGVSQAGWVAPLAATKTDGIAFMVLVSAGGATPRDSELYSYERELDRAGLSPDDRARARVILEGYFDFLATGEGRDKVVASLESIEDTELAPLASQLSRVLPSEENRPNWSWVGTYDPVGHIANLKMPILLLFGELDRDHPTELAIRRWREGLHAAGNEDATIVVFPDAGHGIRKGESHGQHGASFADGYREIQIGWLWLNVVRHRKLWGQSKGTE